MSQNCSSLWDNLRMTDRPRWWLILVAAAMVSIFVYESLGATGTLLLFAGLVASLGAARWYRQRSSARVYCPVCGETLASTARECRHCGSARWPVEN